MLVQGPTLRDAACIWITKYDGYTPPERFIIPNYTTTSTATTTSAATNTTFGISTSTISTRPTSRSTAE